MKAITFAVVLLFFTSILSFAQPGIVWERTYFSGYYAKFYDVHETSDGGFIVAGYRTDFASGDNKIVFRMDSEGNILWMFGYTGWQGQVALWIEELPDQGFIATGGGTVPSGDDAFLLILRLDADGNEIWTKIYDCADSDEVGHCVIPLPDGGFALCGMKSPNTGMDQAWILRTDANGDTLWTREWGYEWNDRAMRILYIDGGLSVLTQYRRSSAPGGGPYLLKYDLDGNLLLEVYMSELSGEYGQDMCYSSSDGGYTLVTENHPVIAAHTDSVGNVIWYMNPMGINAGGYSINPTMDGGYIYAGQNTPYEPDQYEYSGMLVKLDSEGNQQWWDFVYESNCDGLFSARQLSQGGYIAAGIANSLTTSREGYLIRYEPEVGIEGGAGLPGVVEFDVSPNPFSSSLGISYNLPETAQVKLSVYDLSGRLVKNLESGSVPSGEHTSVWAPDPEFPNGCYLIVLDACGERAVRRCVKLD